MRRFKVRTLILTSGLAKWFLHATHCLVIVISYQIILKSHYAEQSHGPSTVAYAQGLSGDCDPDL